jgi:phage N-6-adenine-methyltransferase
VTLALFTARNHPQQVGRRGPAADVDDRGTHPSLFDPLHAQFHFTLDVAAAPHNAKCERYYTREQNGLALPWAGEMVWCNPPYSAIGPWVEKAWSEAPDVRGIVMLLPANRTEQVWWQDGVEPFRDRPGSALRVEFLRGRHRFIQPGRTDVGPNERPPFGNCLLVWRGGQQVSPL